MLLIPALFAGCMKREVDNSYSHSNFQLDLSANNQVIILDEENPDALALTVEWTPAKEYGDDFIMTYTYSMEVSTSTAAAITEYEDEGYFKREYSNAELQTMLTGHFEQKTSTYCELIIKATASYAGPYVVIPDESVLRIKVKTYGPKQFGADRVFLDGTALDGRVELEPSANNADLYVYTGRLKSGNFYFPVIYGDENNAIIPDGNTDVPATSDASAANVVDEKKVEGRWTVAEPEEYRITLNMSARTVSMIKTSDIFEFDKLYMAGSAVGEEMVEFEQTVENSSLYAYYGELKAGSFYLPIEYNEATSLAIAPKSASHDIADGEGMVFAQVPMAFTSTSYWQIPADATYRVVLDVTAMTITIYSPATAKKNTVVSFNKTYTKDGTPAQNPYSYEVTELWMYGGFNAFAKDADAPESGFQKQYCLKQSAADPNVFTYYGKAITRQSSKGQTGSTASQTFDAYFNLKVNWWNNNVYCYGSDAPNAKRNAQDDFKKMELGVHAALKPGQSDNRYAWFFIPEGANYIMVNIETLDIVIDKK